MATATMMLTAAALAASATVAAAAADCSTLALTITIAGVTGTCDGTEVVPSAAGNDFTVTETSETLRVVVDTGSKKTRYALSVSGANVVLGTHANNQVAAVHSLTAPVPAQRFVYDASTNTNGNTELAFTADVDMSSSDVDLAVTTVSVDGVLTAGALNVAGRSASSAANVVFGAAGRFVTVGAGAAGAGALAVHTRNARVPPATSSGTLNIVHSGSATLSNDVEAVGDITIEIGGQLNEASADLAITSSGGAVSLSALGTQGNAIKFTNSGFTTSVSASGAVLIHTPNGGATLESVVSGTASVTLDIAQSLNVKRAVQAHTDVTITTTNAVAVLDVTAATGDIAISANKITATGDVTATAGAVTITCDQSVSGSALRAVTAVGDVRYTGGAFSANGDIESLGGDVVLALGAGQWQDSSGARRIVANNDVTITFATTRDGNACKFDDTNSVFEATNGNLKISATLISTATCQVGQLTAAGSIEFVVDEGSIDTTSNSLGHVTASSVTFRAGHDVRIARSIVSADDIVVDAGGAVSMSGSSTTLTTNGGGDVRVSAVDEVLMVDVDSSDDVYIKQSGSSRPQSRFSGTMQAADVFDAQFKSKLLLDGSPVQITAGRVNIVVMAPADSKELLARDGIIKATRSDIIIVTTKGDLELQGAVSLTSERGNVDVSAFRNAAVSGDIVADGRVSVSGGANAAISGECACNGDASFGAGEQLAAGAKQITANSVFLSAGGAGSNAIDVGKIEATVGGVSMNAIRGGVDLELAVIAASGDTGGDIRVVANDGIMLRRAQLTAASGGVYVVARGTLDRNRVRISAGSSPDALNVVVLKSLSGSVTAQAPASVDGAPIVTS